MSNKFKVGTRVTLDNLRDERTEHLPDKSNTLGSEGVITGIVDREMVPYKVKWDNGTSNVYHIYNLVLSDQDTNSGCVDE